MSAKIYKKKLVKLKNIVEDVKTWSKQNWVLFMINNKKETPRLIAKWMKITKINNHKQIVFLRNMSICVPNLF